MYGSAGYLVPQLMPKAVLDVTDTMLAAGFGQFVVTCATTTCYCVVHEHDALT